MNRQQVAGHLGAANNPNVSASAQHSSRQAIMSSASQGNSDRSQASIAGQLILSVINITFHLVVN